MYPLQLSELYFWNFLFEAKEYCDFVCLFVSFCHKDVKYVHKIATIHHRFGMRMMRNDLTVQSKSLY